MNTQTEDVKQPAEISLKDMALQEIGSVSAGIAVLTEKYSGQVYEVTTTIGMEAAKAARLDIREKRYKIPHIVKEKKQALKKIGDDIQAEGDRITDILLKLETPIDDQIKVEEARKAEIKAEKERKEKERIDGIRARIDVIKDLPRRAVGAPADQIKIFISKVQDAPIGVEFEEFVEEAQVAKDEAIKVITEMFDAQLRAEELAEQIRKDQEFEAKRLEEERIEQEKKAAEETARLEEENKRLAAEREELERKQAEFNESVRKQNELMAAEEEKRVAERHKEEMERLEADRIKAAEEKAAADEKKRLDDEAAEVARLHEEEQRAKEEQARIDALTATHLSTLQAILDMAQDQNISNVIARKGIISLAQTGIARGKA